MTNINISPLSEIQLSNSVKHNVSILNRWRITVCDVFGKKSVKFIYAKTKDDAICIIRKLYKNVSVISAEHD